ncbi:phosphate transporter subunit; ATP-binding component of ABC superfamily [Nitrosopumilaceae archaeon]|nr:phosphate ABC transporter ATP-binding protein PstB [Nitrosopumilus sp.]CAI9831649.1 phosphate transporter subunit; ATP-binding component of ABC superfamily [Nitrosopumilaceae archaeon]MDA7940681.1 phosphate ABC transporter ATP-binding protein PstB [Nitrosopumilus sp.]MDA7942889.1 phosphate ABC transporter ATP-binding protein PstB [Nitrosopumilus sp.]MDA7945324.1 phosphate ABC transporter ATP-binding protein PstB [Nitrosopumilus sp.]
MSTQTREKAAYKMSVEGVTVTYDGVEAVKDVTMGFAERTVTALIGPSGCGKTTLLRCLNRMHDMTKNARVTGRVMLDGADLYDRSVDPIYHRRKVGMVFQKPNPFPTMSIYDNVAAGLRLNGVRDRRMLDEIVEDSLGMAYLWDEVRGDLGRPAVELSGGQQQRLCIARALAIQPEVLLMDEPASALDPIATQKIEETITALKKEYTIIIVTHNMQQAVRISDRTGFMYLGDLVEFRDTRKLFTDPKNDLTARYVQGQFG